MSTEVPSWDERMANVELPAINKRCLGLKRNEVNEFATKRYASLLTDEQLCVWMWTRGVFDVEHDATGNWKRPGINRDDEKFVVAEALDNTLIGYGQKGEFLCPKYNSAKIIFGDNFVGTLANEGENTESIDGMYLGSDWTSYVARCLRENGEDYEGYIQYIEQQKALETEKYHNRIEERARLKGDALEEAMKAKPGIDSIAGLELRMKMLSMLESGGGLITESPDDLSEFNGT